VSVGFSVGGSVHCQISLRYPPYNLILARGSNASPPRDVWISSYRGSRSPDSSDQDASPVPLADTILKSSLVQLLLVLSCRGQELPLSEWHAVKRRMSRFTFKYTFGHPSGFHGTLLHASPLFVSLICMRSAVSQVDDEPSMWMT